jgi:lipid II:glycine glycyltransferase (peptidoglycan interpeptide bridge formation enzyme)
MISYNYPSIIFKKKWLWFTEPEDISGVDLINIFSYQDRDIPGFKKRAGLTTIIDLNQNLDLIWQGMREGFIRKQIEKGIRNEVMIVQDRNFDEFKRIYKSFRKDKGIAEDSYEVFKNYGILFSAYFKGEMIAGGIFISDDTHMRAWTLASKRFDSDGRMREIVGQANRMVIWEAIKYAKAKGFQSFDLGGINPESKDSGEKNLAEFKEAFGGKRASQFYYHKVYSPVLRFLMRMRGRK